MTNFKNQHKNSLVYSLEVLLRDLGVLYTKSTINDLQDHPNHPSILSVSYILDQLQIPNITLRGNYRQLVDDYPKPAIVYTKQNGGSFSVIKEANNDLVGILKKSGEIEYQEKERFINSWTGVTLLVDKKNQGKEKNYLRNKIANTFSQVKHIMAFVSLICLIILSNFYGSIFTSAALQYSILLISKFLGILVSIGLLMHELDNYNPYIKKICSSSRIKKHDCSKILNSSASKVFDLFSWADVGFIYFATGFLALLIFPNNSLNNFFLLLAFLSAFYIPYSIIFQWRVAKFWCRLCLLIQGILFLEFLIALFKYKAVFLSLYDASLIYIAMVLLLFILVVSVYGIIKPIYFKNKELVQAQKEVNSIKYNPSVFKFLQKGRYFFDFQGLNPIIYGNANGKNVLRVITNPTCPSCLKLHKIIIDILDNPKNDLRIEEIFLVGPNTDSFSRDIALTILYLFRNNKEHLFYSQLHDLYRGSLIYTRKWMKNTELYQDEHIEELDLLKKYGKWCISKGIRSAPKVFLNGYQLPKGYSFNDLKYLIDLD